MCEPATGDAGLNGASGIMAYRNECHFMKTAEDDGNPAGGPDIAEPDHKAGLQTPNSTCLGSQGWTGAEMSSLPTRERGSGTSPYVPLQGLMPSNSVYGPDMDSGSTNDMSPDGQSNRPTPSSSAASEQRHNLVPGPHMGSSGGNSYKASPVSPHQNLSMVGTTQSEVDRNVDTFFNHPTAFGIPPGVSTGLTPSAQFSMPDTSDSFSGLPGWDITGPNAMTPGDGVLGTIMSVGTMESSMDLRWDNP
jgi:hypothetical protein